MGETAEKLFLLKLSQFDQIWQILFCQMTQTSQPLKDVRYTNCVSICIYMCMYIKSCIYTCNHKHLLSDSNPSASFSLHKVQLKQGACEQCTNGLKTARKVRGRKYKQGFFLATKVQFTVQVTSEPQSERFYPGNYDCSLSCCYSLAPAVAHSGTGSSYVSLLGKQ